MILAAQEWANSQAQLRRLCMEQLFSEMVFLVVLFGGISIRSIKNQEWTALPQVRRVEVRVLRVLRVRRFENCSMRSLAPKSWDLEVFQKKAKLGVDMMLVCKLKPGPEASHLALISGNCFCGYDRAMTVFL